MEPLSCEGGEPWRDGELLLTFLKEVSLFFCFNPMHCKDDNADDKNASDNDNDLLYQVEHKGLSGEIKLAEGMRTHFQLDVMDKVRIIVTKDNDNEDNNNNNKDNDGMRTYSWTSWTR